jgi:hypothetical protein
MEIKKNNDHVPTQKNTPLKYLKPIWQKFRDVRSEFFGTSKLKLKVFKIKNFPNDKYSLLSN